MGHGQMGREECAVGIIQQRGLWVALACLFVVGLFARRHFKMAGPGWQRDDLFEMRDPNPGEDYGQGESLLLFGDVLGTGTVAGER